MKGKNTITLEEIDNNKVKTDVEDKKSILKFFAKEVLPLACVCLVICIILTLVSVISTVDHIKVKLGCTELFCGSKVGIGESLFSRIEMLGLTLVAAVVPYFYLPALGLIGYMYNEIISLSHVINIYGYTFGIVKYIIPFVLNILTISVTTSLGIYLAKNLTAKYIKNRRGTMNFTKFRLKIYEVTKNTKKYEELAKKEETRIKKMDKMVKKICWKNIAIIFVIILIIQIVSVCLEKLFI